MPKLVLKASLQNPISSLSYVSSVSSSMYVPSMSYPSASYTSSGSSQSFPITASKPSIRCAPISRVENSFIPQSSSVLSFSSPSSMSFPLMTSYSSDPNKDQNFHRLDSLLYLQMLQKLKEQSPADEQANYHRENIFNSLSKEGNE